MSRRQSADRYRRQSSDGDRRQNINRYGRQSSDEDRRQYADRNRRQSMNRNRREDTDRDRTPERSDNKFRDRSNSPRYNRTERTDKSNKGNQNSIRSRSNTPDPKSSKDSNLFCRKCYVRNSHPEADCPLYKNLAPEQCAKCTKGRHYQDKCKNNPKSRSSSKSDSPRSKNQ
jgi:hypothetical protein